jgi:hypothetical protein
MNYLWSDMLWCPEFKKQFIHQTCHMAMEMAQYTGNGTPRLARLNLSDTKRIDTIREEVSIQRLEENMQDSEYMKGDERLMQGFAACIQKVNDCRDKIAQIVATCAGRPNEKHAKAAKEIIDTLFFESA